MNRAVAALGSRTYACVARSVARKQIPALTFDASRWMSNYYLESHEFIKVNPGKKDGTVGITGFAADALGDIVFVDLPEVGSTFEKGCKYLLIPPLDDHLNTAPSAAVEESFGSVESVKAASDVYAPVSCEVVEINEALSDAPETINKSPMVEGWFIKVKLTNEGELSSLLDQAAYEKHCKSQKH